MNKVFRHRVLFPFMVLVLFLGVTSSSASAQNSYFGIQAGAVLLSDADIEQSGLTAETSFDTGYLIGLTLGQKFDQFRLEGELSYRSNSVSDISLFGVSVPADGDTTSTSLMINGYYDIKTGSSVTPYLGAGIGFSQVSINDLSVDGERVADDDDIVFAYQLAAGIAFNINPSITLDLGYKYFATSDPSFNDVTGFPFDAEYSSHNFTVGMRFNF